MPTRSLALLASVALLWSGLAHSTASNKELEARANEMDARLAAVERANQTLVQVQQQIESARQDLRALRGQIEEAKHEIETLRQQQRDLYNDLDRRLLLLENRAGMAPAGPRGAAAAVGAPAGSTAGVQAGAAGAAEATGVQSGPGQDVLAADESTIYGDAFAALKAGRYDEAVQGFQLYLTKYPEGPRAADATYWLGEAHYVQRDYVSAIKNFNRVVTAFPDTRKAPEALLKVGFCQYELKSFRNARVTLQKVANTYPGTQTARLAEERLAKMDVEGR